MAAGQDGLHVNMDAPSAVPGDTPSPLDRQLTLQQLRVFKSVVDHRNFTRAAEALYLTQPAVTHQVQGLARTMGQPLFTGRDPGDLTPLGVIVYERACAILSTLHELDEAVADLDHVRAGLVRVAGDVTFGTYILPRAVSAFAATHADIQVRLEVVRGSSIRDLLLRRDADLGIVGRLWDDRRIDSRPVMENAVTCYCAPTHPFAGRVLVELEDLADGILLVRENGSGLSNGVRQLFADAGLEMRPAMEIADNEARKRAAIEGLGVAVLSTHAVRSELVVGLLVPMSVAGFPLSLTWHAVWATDHPLAPATEAFRDFLCSSSWGQGSVPAAPRLVLEG